MSEQAIAAIKRKSVRGVVSFFMRTLLLQGIGLVSIFVLSAFFSPEDFGVFGIVTQIIALLVFFSDIGLAAALIQKKDEPSPADFKTAFSVQFLLAWMIFALVWTLTQWGVVVDKIGAAGVQVLLALAISFPLATLKTISSIMLERRLDFNKLVLPQIFEQLVFHGLLISLAWQGYGVLAYFYAILARSVVGVIVMQVLQPWLPRFQINLKSLRELIGFGLKFQLSDLLARIKDQLYFLFLGAYLPLRDFGYMQWAKNWSMYPYNLTVQNVMAVTFPTFSRLQGQPQLLQRAIEKSIYFITLLIFPILVGMTLFIYPLTELVSHYQKWQPALLSFGLFTISIAWSAISSPLVNSLNAIGKINQTLKLMIMWTVLTWVLTPILLKYFGFNGVALAAFLISFSSVFAVILAKKYIRLRLWQQTRVQLLASVLMAVVAVLGQNYWSLSFAHFTLGGLLAVMTYICAVLLFGGKQLTAEIRSLRQSW